MASVLPLSVQSDPAPWRRALLEAIVPLVLIAAWWFTSAGSTALYFPALSRILDSFVQDWFSAAFVTDVLPTLGRLFIGLLISAVLGIGIGVVLGLLPVLSDIVAPVTEFFRAIPGVALLPAALLLFGIGPGMPIALIAYGTVWPILLNTIDGVRGIEPGVRDVAASYRIRFRERLFMIILPAASPQIMAGLRTALAIGVTVIVFAEMIGSTNGIGFQILQAQRSFAVPRMWAGIVFLGILGFVLNLLFWALESSVLRWHRNMRAVNR
ncbi:ABC transporter permease [Lysinimonas soli]|uniref:ABC transporter permease n=1 Tax=Lysinimonas soli TaxID=1074233 RepID=A0ABW0NPS4_9MICO